jgi:hypothetical protein
VAGRILGLPTDVVAKAADGGGVEGKAGITPAEILAIVEVVMQLVQLIAERCKNKTAIVAAASGPSLAQRVYVRVLAHEVCAAREERRSSLRSGVVASAVLESASRMTAEDVAAIVEEAADPINNWLI